MTIYLTISMPTLTDFLIAAVILMLFHLANLLEILSFKKAHLDNFYPLKIRSNATFTLIGVALTVACGMFVGEVGATLGRLLIIVPFIFIIVWSYFQVKNSQLLSFLHLKDWVRNRVKDELTLFAENKQRFELNDLFDYYRDIVVINSLIHKWKGAVPKKQKVRFLMLSEMVQPLLLDGNEIMDILADLCEEKVLQYDVSSLEYIYVKKV